MKKIVSFFIAALALSAAVSCVQEQLAIFDETKATAPEIVSYEATEDGVSVVFNPGSFTQSFNQKMPVNHSLVLLSADGKNTARVLTSSVDGSTISVTSRNLSKGLATLGYVDGDVVGQVVLSLRASLQEQARDNGRNGFVESVGRVNLTNVLVTLPQESPYKEYTKASDWTITGSLSAYEISWDKDLNMWTDGHNHVAAHVTLGKDDEFKFRKDLGWDVNYGGTFAGLDTEFDLAGGGDNIKVGVEGVYDIFFNDETKKAWVSEAFDPYPAFTESSTWSVIGNLSVYKIEWNDDLPMISDGTSHLALSVSLGKDDEFKFRKDADWGVNLGGDFGGLGNDFAVSQDGPNIKVGSEGFYDIMLNPETNTASVSEASGARVSSIVGVKPEEPEEEKGWGILGDFNGWDNDVEMTEEEGVWTGFFTNVLKEDGSMGAFKFRKNLSWDTNLGATGDNEPVEVKYNEAIDLVANGKNFCAPAGLYKVILDMTNEEAPTATFIPSDVFSLIGKINGTSWDTDFEMTGENGVYTSDVVYIDGGFKIRHNFSWADENTYGAAEGMVVTPGTAFTAVQPGKDISLEAGNYKVRFNAATLEVLVTSVNYELPEIDLSQFEVLDIMAGAETWGLIGPAQSGGWDTDLDLQKIQDEPEIWAAMNIPLQGDKFKFRGNDTWGDYDLGGGTFALDAPIVMTKGGSDMTAERGVYTVFLYPTYGVAYFTAGSGDVPLPPAKPEVCSLIGTLDEGSPWGVDHDLTNTGGDVWTIKNVAMAAGTEFKIRADHDWSRSWGGPDGNAKSLNENGEEYDVYVPVIGEVFPAGDKNIRIDVAGVYNVTFNYGDEPTILIEEYKEYPDDLYMVGQDFGGWDWNAGGVVVLNHVVNEPSWGSEAEGQFWTVRYLTAGHGIKFNGARAWDGGQFGKLETNEGFTNDGDENVQVAEDGIYMIHVDLKRSILHLEPARLYGIGDCFGGWDNMMQGALLAKEGSVARITIPNTANFRMYAESTISTSPWWSHELNLIDGVITLRVHDDLPNVPVKAEQEVVLDFSTMTGEIKGEGVTPAVTFGDYIYLVGADTGWSSCYPLRSGKDVTGANDGKYKGFGYLSQEFKFKPNEDNWTGDWEYDGEGKIADNGSGVNCPAPTAAYYMFEVDLNVMTYTLTPITTIGIIGPAQAGGWDTDTDMEYNAAAGCWEIKGVTLGADLMKFRANDAWDINWGGALDALVQGGGDISVAAGTYDIQLFAWCDGKAYATMTEAAPAGPVEIKIDGDMSDWAAVQGSVNEAEDPAYAEFKIASDENNIYFYARRTAKKFADIWDGGGYLYWGFDLDNNAETGDATIWGNGPYEILFVIWPYGGTKDAPAFAEKPLGESQIAPSGSLANYVAAGTFDAATGVELEFSIPRADLPAIPADHAIRVFTWGNKSGENMKNAPLSCTL